MADQKISADTTVTPAGADFFPILQGGANKKSTIASIPISTATQTALDAKQDTITGLTASGAELNILDGATLSTTELNYVDGVTSAIQTQLNAKQATLVSGTNIKTVNGNSLLGSGDLTISGGGSVATDTIWDSKGDLAVGTGANTASRLAVGTNGQVLTADSAEVIGLKWSNPAGGGDALTSGTLAQFAATTSLELKGVISDETGSGSLVFATSPTLVTPVLGVATATSLNGATITSGTLNGSVTGTNTGNQTLANTSNATSHTVTLSATGGSVQLVEGAGITLTTTGTSADGIVTIASTGGGSGDVVGPASATDNAVARFDTTTGKLLQNSGVTIGDTNIVSGVATLNTQAINATAQVDFSYDFSDTILSGGGFTFYGATHRRINDGGSNELIKFPTTSVSGAVNEFTISNAATGNGPILEATGGDTNIDVNITTKGTGVLKVNGSAIGTGNITKVGTPVNNQVGVWTGDGTLEGDTALTFDTTTDTLATTLITATTVTANLVGNVTGNASGTAATVTSGTQAAITSAANLATVGTITTGTWNATDIAVADGGTGRSTGTTAYSLIATGTTATGAQQTLANGATTEVLVGGGASALPVWTTATGSGAPVRATSPTLVTPALGTPASGTLTNCIDLPLAGLVDISTNRILGRSTAGSGAVEELNVTAIPALIGLGTSDSPQFTGVNIGHATDTTITRVSAGKTAVEGVNQGTEGILQNSQSAAYTLVLTDAGKHIYHPSADTTARIWTIPANASVAFPIGTAVTFINDTSAGTLTIAITSDTLVLAGAGTTGSRTLTANGIATAVKVTSTRWIISGTSNLT